MHSTFVNWWEQRYAGTEQPVYRDGAAYGLHQEPRVWVSAMSHRRNGEGQSICKARKVCIFCER